MKINGISIAIWALVAGIAYNWELNANAEESLSKAPKDPKSPVAVQVWKTTARITETNDSGLAAIPEGVEVKVVEKDGKSFISHGRTLISMETAKDSIVSVGKNIPGTTSTPKAESGAGSPSTSSIAAAEDGGLTEEEQQILLKGKPEYTLREEIKPLQSSKITQEAGFRFRYQQITQEVKEINMALSKGRIVGNAKTRLPELERMKAQLQLEQQRASLAYTQAVGTIQARITKEQIAYSNALAKQKKIEEAKGRPVEEKAQDSK